MEDGADLGKGMDLAGDSGINPILLLVRNLRKVSDNDRDLVLSSDCKLSVE